MTRTRKNDNQAQQAKLDKAFDEKVESLQIAGSPKQVKYAKDILKENVRRLSDDFYGCDESARQAVCSLVELGKDERLSNAKFWIEGSKSHRLYGELMEALGLEWRTAAGSNY